MTPTTSGKGSKFNRHITTQHHTPQPFTAPHITTRHAPTRDFTARHGTLLHDTEPHSTARHIMPLHATARHPNPTEKTMYRISVKITGQAPLSQSRKHDTPKLDGESHEELDQRTWREKCNYDDKGIVFVPAMAFQQSMAKAAQRLAIPDPDNKRALMTKYFLSDVICERNLSININKDDMPSIRLSMNADGKRGSGARVPRILPQTQEWQGETSFLIMDEKVKPEMFERVLVAAGRSVGVGQFRPENGGLNGRFNVDVIGIEKL